MINHQMEVSPPDSPSLSLLQPPAHSRVISSFSSPTILLEESLSCPQRAASCKGSKCNGRSENSEGIKVVGWGIGVKIELHPRIEAKKVATSQNIRNSDNKVAPLKIASRN